MRTKHDSFVLIRTVAEILEITVEDVRKLIRRGLLTAYRCELRFKESQILAYMERVDSGELPIIGYPSWLTLRSPMLVHSQAIAA